ncbi:MAG TPA: hypothetical protein PLW86_08210 [Rhodocyclaceae bacterium]|nr:hypothetical protein [Rhodocyclaceae bacterium]
MTLVAGCAHGPDILLVYEEHIDSLAISPSGDTLVVLGDAYHYVLKPPKSLIAALNSNLRRLLAASFEDFQMTSPSDISGQWTLLLDARKLSEDLASVAREIGFKVDWTGFRMVLTGGISGARYRKNDTKPITGTEKTNQVYTIRVRTKKEFADQNLVQASPISNGENGGMKLGFILLMPLLLPIVLFSMSNAR